MTSATALRVREGHNGDQQNEQSNNDAHRKIYWKDIFSFTTRKHVITVCASAAFATIAALVMPAMAIIYGQIFHEFANFGAGAISSAELLHNTTRWIIFLTGITAVGWVSSSCYFMLQLAFGELQAQNARQKIFDVLLRKKIGWYDLKNSGVPAMLSGIQMHVRDLQLSTSQPLGEGYQMVIMSIGALVVAFYSCWDLTLVIISIVPVIFLVMGLLGSRLSQRAVQQGERLQQATKHVTSAISNIETVKCFNGERFELRRFILAIDRVGTLYKQQANFRSLQIGFMQLVTMGVFVQAFWYGSHLVVSGKRNTGQVVTTFWGALMAIQGITGFIPQLIVLQKGKVAAAGLKLLLEDDSERKEQTETDSGDHPPRCTGDIEFKKIFFSYPTRPDQAALDNVSAFFPAGETTFVVGRSGSGKSTMGHLLVRLYDPQSGHIYIDGLPADQLALRWLRENITLVEQHSVLFNETIRRNIALGRGDGHVTARDIHRAIDFAVLKDVINTFPQGLDTAVGIKGNALSGGQKQRLAMARARIRNTPILVLDESTSALDYVTRSLMFDAIRKWRQGKTTIVITHDMSQILPDDYVYIMNEAQVIRDGYLKDFEAKPDPLSSELLEQSQRLKYGDYGESETDDETEEIMSLYDESWTTCHSTVAETIFGEAIASPFLAPNRNSLLMTTYRRQSTVPSDIFRSPSPGGETLHRNSVSRALPSPYTVNDSLGVKHKHFSRPLSIVSDPRFSLTQALPTQKETFNKTHKRNDSGMDSVESNDSTTVVIPSTTLTISHVLKTVWPALDSRHRIMLICAISCAMVHAACTPSFAFVFARLLSTFYATADQQKLALRYALIILGIAILDGIAAYSFHFLFDICAQRWANFYKEEAMRRILKQPRQFFDHEINSIASISECLGHLGEEARNLPGRFLGIVIVMIAMVCVALIWSLIICWKITLVALATGPILFAIMRGYNAVSGRWETRTNAASEAVGQIMHETFTSIRTVRCLQLETIFQRKSRMVINMALKTGIKRGIYIGSIFGLNLAAPYFVACLLLWYGSTVLASREFTITNIIETFTIILLSVNQVNYIGNYIPQINVSKDAASRLLRLARLPQDSHEQDGDSELPNAGDITLQNVNFSYPVRKDQQILTDVSLKIPKGSCTAIVGPSGSGKSTIASLLLKLYPIEASAYSHNGRITISGHDIKDLQTLALRSHMAIVSQTPVLFPGTVAENIAYGLSPSSPIVSHDNVRLAAQAAGVDDFIMSLSNGYQTIVGEGGTGVSGGQAQRIAIARALIRNPDILILDEATSALDGESANIIRETVQRLVAEKKQPEEPLWQNGTKKFRYRRQKRNMTVIIITHAREMMAIAENIIMLDKGKVIEEGGFDDLRYRGGPFSRLLQGKGVED
ncbi:P-loop containing nucleoside triphosphate hydrolase protein [Aaosphaeria arxii CBS 175.79]|uniref:P-loop containing nucleoside triphosphate hydrolase protein n=1 Tax=Aaosphaeria arxii CBS 175.79 TaxID=1450172 RepID=A0A6A5Y8R2_9PLEO|nr:P-loop containing nucleoside triphosphate hydrolase protein [Aaosphaeria arxii CBS 175.79]KAF2021965.1 P-loop containing nucleoside triphosphate hydrolase protein [Aaosphaeria arxii CBS 175.79]